MTSTTSRRRWRGLRLDGRVELLLGLGRLSRPAQQVGLEQVPVAGEAQLPPGADRAGRGPRTRGIAGRPSRPARGRPGRPGPPPGETEGCRPGSGCCRRRRPSETARSRRRAPRRPRSRGLGSCGLEQRRPRSSSAPAPSDRPPPETGAAARGAGRGSLQEPVEQLDRLRPAPPAHLGVGRRLRRPVERGGHLERQLFAAGEVERQILDLAANGRQVPRQLVVGRWAPEPAAARAATTTASHQADRHDEPTAPGLVDKDGNLFGNRVLRLGVEEDRQDRRGKQPESQRVRGTG